MPDPLRGATVQIDGKTYTAKFTHEALRIAQQRMKGRPVAEIFRDDMKDLGMDVLCELAAAAFYHEDKRTSDKFIMGLLENDPGAYYPLTTAVVNAFVEAQIRLLPPDLKKEAQKQVGEAMALLENGSAPTDGGSSASASGSAASTEST